MIILKDVSKQYNNIIILENINLELKPNNIYGFVGKNASGKTVIFKMICGFVPCSSGQIFIDNKQIGKDTDYPKDTGVIIETPGFIDDISGFKNLKILSLINKKIDDNKIKATMKTLGLDPENKLHVKKYSLGMKQKLALCQAIMEDPKILILDEPMNGLDSESVENVRNILLNLKNKGTTILISSHNSIDIETLCDKVYEVKDNRVFPL